MLDVCTLTQLHRHLRGTTYAIHRHQERNPQPASLSDL